jgi:hypothetical protein
MFLTAYPLDNILVTFLNQPNSFKYVCDVINSPFLYVKHVDCIVKVNTLVLSCLDKLDEFLCKYPEAVILSSAS